MHIINAITGVLLLLTQEYSGNLALPEAVTRSNTTVV